MNTIILKKLNRAAVLLTAIGVVAMADAQPAITLTSPFNGSSFPAPASVTLSATVTDPSGTVTNVAYYQGANFLGHATNAPYTVKTASLFAGGYALTAVAADNHGATGASSPVNIMVTNTAALSFLQSIKTVMVIPLENHDFTQRNPTGQPQQLLHNPACPFFNSLVTPGNPNAAQTSYATHYYSCAIDGEHPSEPNYVWSEAGTDFGIRNDYDPSPAAENLFTAQHLTGQMTAAGIVWKTYQEDVEYSRAPAVSAYGITAITNIYNKTTEYNYAVKHNPMEFFTDTQNKNCYPLANLFRDINDPHPSAGKLGRYNWISPDQFNEMHSALPGGFTYHGVKYTGNQAAIASGDNFLSIVVPEIQASAAYKDHGVLIIWTDETESTDDTNTTLPYVILSPMAKGNAYASSLPYNHSSDLRTMDEIFGLAYQTNAIPEGELDARGTGYDYVDGHSARVNDLRDFFRGVGVTTSKSPAGYLDNLVFSATVFGIGTPSGAVQFLTNGVPAGSPVTLVSSTATFRTTLLPPGTTVVSAQYSGDPQNPPSTNSLTQIIAGQLPIAGISK